MSFSVARIFSNNMVLQHLKPVNVFGLGDDGTKITVSITGEEAATVTATVKNGRWLAVLPPQPPQDDVELTVSDGVNSITYRNVAVGVVWLAGGQSNMEFELQNCYTGRDSMANDKPDVRFYYTQKRTLLDDDFYEQEKDMVWRLFGNNEETACWSAIGYYFAKELAEELGMTVGVIGCNWGGTSASAWMDRSYAKGETAIYFDEYDAAISGKTTEELVQGYKDYQAYHAAWEKKSAEYYSTTPNPTWGGCLAYCSENKYPGPPAPNNPMSPSVLYHSMVERIAPYTMTGVIWYQGESDDHRPDMYYTLLNQMMQNWRDLWQDDELFFVIGQLPMHKWSGEEDRKHWCVIREAQAKTAKRDRNAALAVFTECGEFNEIHPKNKQTPGHRFFLAAMNGCYDADFENTNGTSTMNPEVFEVIWNEDSVDIFVNCGSALEVRGESGEIHGFETADESGVFQPAKAVIVNELYWGEGDETADESGAAVIRISGVSSPSEVRYLWTNYTEDITLFDKETDIPLMPFRVKKPSYMG